MNFSFVCNSTHSMSFAHVAANETFLQGRLMNVSYFSSKIMRGKFSQIEFSSCFADDEKEKFWKLS